MRALAGARLNCGGLHADGPRMMVRSALLLVAAFSLSGCCMTGSACYGPTASAAAGPPASDGLGAAPTEDDAQVAEESPPKKSARAKPNRAGSADAASASSNPYLRSGDSFEQQEAADRADEARLKRKMVICHDCASTGPVNNDVLGSSR
jgi:hypothetical protein